MRQLARLVLIAAGDTAVSNVLTFGTNLRFMDEENLHALFQHGARGRRRVGRSIQIRHVDGRLQVDRLHYEFHGWLGDCLVESTPCFVVTRDAEHALLSASATGIRFDPVEVSRSETFDELQPDCHLPEFSWMVVEGQAGRDDFGIGAGLILIVSEHALDVLRQAGLTHASIEVLAEE